MPRITYEPWSPRGDARDAIAKANAICRTYARDGYDITLRQLYYRFVAADLFPDDRKWSWTGSRWMRADNGTKNAEPNYKWLGEIINKARLAGLLDWNYIVDRTRGLRGNSHWDSPADIIRSAAAGYALDKWRGAGRRVEVWVEKDALAGVVERAASTLDVNWFSCRGYVSQSEQWAAARRILRYLANGQAVTILHLGDHDPSGVDMTRDIIDRITNFITQDWLNDHMPAADGPVKVREILEHMAERVGDPTPFEVRRIALNMDQVREYNPPPNPAKLTDSRAGGYISTHGDESWELDALPPEVLVALVTDNVESLRHDGSYYATLAEEERGRRLLNVVVERWANVVEHLTGETPDDDGTDDDGTGSPYSRHVEPPEGTYAVRSRGDVRWRLVERDDDGFTWWNFAEPDAADGLDAISWERLWNEYGPILPDTDD